MRNYKLYFEIWSFNKLIFIYFVAEIIYNNTLVMKGMFTGR